MWREGKKQEELGNAEFCFLICFSWSIIKMKVYFKFYTTSKLDRIVNGHDGIFLKIFCRKEIANGMGETENLIHF